MNRQIERKVEEAKKAIDTVHADTTGDVANNIEALEAVQEHLADYLQMLREAKRLEDRR